MFCKITRCVTVIALLLATSVAWAASAEPPTTTIHIKNMHCGHCAQKISRKLYGVASVKQVKTNYKRGVAQVTPEAARQPSPKELWEAVEKAGFKPLKIVTPEGAFNEKPEA